jgi:predicted nucleic acid-binding protein
MKAIADTGFIVAFGRLNDQHHAWAVNLADSVSEPLLTCEAVLAEAAYHLGSSSFALSLVEDELLQVNFDFNQNLPQLRELADRYADRKPDLADLCLIRMSELHPRHTVITVDESDFRAYRRNKREAIPLLCPPRPDMSRS